MALILLCLFAMIYLDIRLFMRLDRGLFDKFFRISALTVWGEFFLFLIVLIFAEDKLYDLSLMILVTILPVYILRRHYFTSAAEKSTGWIQAHRTFKLLSDALGVIIIWIFSAVVFELFLSNLGNLFPEVLSQMGELLISAIFSSALIIILIYKPSNNISDQGFLINVGLSKRGRSWFKIAVLPVVLGLMFAFFSSYLTVARQVHPQTPLNEVIATTQSLGLIMVFFFLAVAIAPLVEEIVFRGYFFYVIKEWLGGRKAIYIISLTFASLHVGQYWGDWLAIAMVALLGFTLTMLRAWTGTTIAGVITHYVYNGGVTIIPIIIIAITNPAYFEYKTYFPNHDTATKEALLKESIAKQPDLLDALNDLAWLYADEDKNLDEALNMIEQTLRVAPDHPVYLDTKAIILEKQGRIEEADAIRDGLDSKGY